MTAQVTRDWVEVEFLSGFLGQGGKPTPGLIHTAEEVEPEWFAHPFARNAWIAMRKVAREGSEIDAFTVTDAMRRVGASEGSISFVVNELVCHPAFQEPPAKLQGRVDALRDRHLRVRLENIAQGILKAVKTSSLADITASASEGLGEIISYGSHGGLEVVDYKNILEIALSGQPVLPGEKRQNKIRFGIQKLDDEVVAGPGTLGVLAAKTSAGKTALSIQAALATARLGLNPLIINLEMEQEDVGARLVASVTGRDSFKILRFPDGPISGVDQDTKEAVNRIRAIHAPSGEPWRRIEGAIRREHRKRRVDTVIIDYFTLLDPPSTGNKNASVSYQLGDLSKAMKRLAAQLSLSILVLSQFNRGVEDGQEPKLENLRETGQLEQDASYVLLMWTDKAKYGSGEDRGVNIRVAKNRGGKRWGEHYVTYNPALNTFVEKIRETNPTPSINAPRNGGYSEK